MANLVISVNTKDGVANVHRLEDVLDKLGDTAEKTEQDIKKFSDTTKSGLADAAKAVAALYSGSQLARLSKDAIMLADSYSAVTAKLKLVSKDSAELKMIQGELFNISQKTGSQYLANASSYAKLGFALEGQNIQSSELLKISKLLNETLAINGSSTQEATSFIFQFTQALGSGRLQGDEFRAMIETNSYFAGLLAKSLHMTRSEMKAMSSEGRLTTEVLIDAFQNIYKTADDTFSKLPMTISRAMEGLKNVYGQILDGANTASDGTSKIATSIVELTKTVDENKATIGALFEGLLWGANESVKGVSRVVRSIQMLAIVAASESISIGDWIMASPEDTKKLLESVENGVAFVNDQIVIAEGTLRKYKDALELIDPEFATENDLKSMENLNQLISQQEALIARLVEQRKELAKPVTPYTVSSTSAPDPSKFGGKRAPVAGSPEMAQLDNAIRDFYKDIDSTLEKDFKASSAAASKAAREVEKLANAREKAHRERVEAMQQIAELELRLMPEGLDKELQSAALNAKKLHAEVVKLAESGHISSAKMIELGESIDKAFEIERIDASLEDFFGSLDERSSHVSEEMKKDQESVAKSIENAITGWASSYSNTLNEMLWGSEQTFGGILESFGKMITQMIIQKQMIEPFLAGAGDLGSALFSGILGFFGGSSAVGKTSNMQGAYDPSKFTLPWRQGGVPVADISEYSNSIVSKPTYFAKGGNVMGEAGREGIFPLKEMSSGNLGIEGTIATPKINVIINNYGDAKVSSTETSMNSDGEIDFTITLDMLDKGLAGKVNSGDSALGKVLESGYGLSKAAGSYR